MASYGKYGQKISATQEAGGIYLFDSQANAEKYLNMHTARLQSFGIDNIRGKIFEVNNLCLPSIRQTF